MFQHIYYMLGLVVFCCSLSAPAYADEEIVINGSTTLLPVIQEAAEVFMHQNPGVAIAISGGGSGNGLNALGERLCQIAMSSRDIKSDELQEAVSKGVAPTRYAIAYDALVPVVHPANPVQDLSLEQLRAIYAGEITNWREVGGADARIIIISRDTSSGTFETWAELVMHGQRVTPAALLQTSNGIITTIIAKNTKALGYIGYGYLNHNLKPLQVEGIAATAEAIVSKKWPITRELYLFTAGAPLGNIKRFIDFMLDKQKGQRIVVETGFVPL